MDKTKVKTKKFMSEKELAEHWNVKRNTLQKWRSSGCGPLYLKIGGKVVYMTAMINEYEKNRTYRGTAEKIDQGK